MSYTIEYDKIFLKSGAGYTPLWLAGDSNCYEGSGRNQRRVRDWSVFMSQLGVTEEKLMERIQPLLGGPYQEHWQRRGKWVDDKGLVTWVKNGCKNAVSIEQLIEANRFGAIKCCVMESYMKMSSFSYIHTTDELDDWIKAAKEEIAAGKDFYPRITLNYGEPVRHLSKPKAQDELVVVKDGKYFVSERSPGSISTSKNRREAMIFSVDDAKEILRDFPKCKIVSASVLDAPCNIIVEVDDGSGIPNYLVGFPGPYKVRYTASIKGAKRYSTKAAAEKAAQTAKRRYPEWRYSAVELPAEV